MSGAGNNSGEANMAQPRWVTMALFDALPASHRRILAGAWFNGGFEPALLDMVARIPPDVLRARLADVEAAVPSDGMAPTRHPYTGGGA